MYLCMYESMHVCRYVGMYAYIYIYYIYLDFNSLTLKYSLSSLSTHPFTVCARAIHHTCKLNTVYTNVCIQICIYTIYIHIYIYVCIWCTNAHLQHLYQCISTASVHTSIDIIHVHAAACVCVLQGTWALCWDREKGMWRSTIVCNYAVQTNF